ncbi:iron complex outermembrane receptor protein [Pedobacter africanus]|uniref:Iron complex outermembrane receptor protein n=1 Tax=Pedobacter africanus TaxID=151894 RepID=A0ACC6L2U0_9SPHI|nr:TonB-dependent receptor [Pedobacter africanus]MDR6785919.1 iron complex outermembrane receptor protein [Pedobacter africanus]
MKKTLRNLNADALLYAFLYTLLNAFLVLTALPASAQQNATIKGRVVTAEGKPAEGISVKIKGRKIGDATNGKGEYKISNVSPGDYTLQISAIGISYQERQVTVTAGEELQQNFSLSETNARLQEVNISEGRKNKFVARKSETVAKMPLRSLENPQVYTTISKELITEQLVTNFNDVLKNSPGLDKLWTSTGRPGDGAAYFSLRGFVIQPTMVNGIAGLTNGDLDPAGIEKVEIIKGPSGTLFGGALTSFGGLINVVTKKPVDTLGGSLSYTVGNFSQSRLTADVYGPLNKEKTLLARVNTAYHYQNSFQDAGFRKSFYVAPAIEYRASDKLLLNLDAEFYNYEGTNPLMVFLNRTRQLIARNPKELDFDWKRSYTANDLTVKTPSVNIRGKATYQINDQWTSQTNISRSLRKSDGFYQYVMYIGASDTLLNRYAAYQNSTSTATAIQQNFIGDFKIGNLRNRLVVGLDFLSQINDNNNSPYLLFDQVSSIRRDDPRYIALSRSTLTARLGASNTGASKTSNTMNIYSVYFSDVLNVTDDLLALASLRVDRFHNKGTYSVLTNKTGTGYLQTAFSPKFGLVYQLVRDKVSLFGNYMNGFKNAGTAQVIKNNELITEALKPQQANQIEGGIKLDVLNNRLSFTANYYNISVNNMAFNQSVDFNGTNVNITIQDGTQKSKGYELDLAANPIQGLNLILGYSHNDSKMTKASLTIEGRRPVSAGPEDLVNFWLSYTVPNGALNGLGAGFGGNYASKNIITSTTTTGDFTLPAYTVLNASLFYNMSKFRIGLKMDNLTDKQYFKGWTTVEVQQPRSFMANISFKF